MNEVGVFKSDKTLSNKALKVSFSPSNNVKMYSYQVFKGNVPFGNLVNKSNSAFDIVLSENGRYHIHVKAVLFDESVKDLYSDFYTVDLEKPIINVTSEKLVIKKNVKKEIIDNVKAYDGNEDITQNIKTNLDSLNLNSFNNQKLVYKVEDKAGNISTREIDITVPQNQSYIFIIYGVLISFIIVLLFIYSKINKALKLEERIEEFTVKSFKEKQSISEKFLDKYKIIVKRISLTLDKSVVLKKYFNRLERYLPVTNVYENGQEVFAGKIAFGFIFSIAALFINLFKLNVLDIYEIVLIFTVSFFALDILYFIKYKVYRVRLESDFISAITIMNNSFKSGRSITQAIDTVKEQLKGPIGREFERMSLELLYGLGIDVVFKRFSKRIDLEEASYLTASLTILNKTGGDIIKVFDSIEKSMFDKRKLRLEMKSLTSGSKIVVGVLLGMPFFFCLVIGLINPEYFVPFFTTPIGIILLIFMIIYYIIFLVVVRRVMKVVI